MRKCILIILFLIAITQANAFQVASENYNFSLIVIDSSGTNIASENYNLTLAIGQIAYTNISSENYNFHFGIFPYRFIVEAIKEAIIEEEIGIPEGVGGGGSPTLSEIIEQQKQGIQACGIFIKPDIINLNNTHRSEIIQIRYTNPYVIFVNATFIKLGELPDATPYIEKNFDYNVMWEYLNITIKLKEDAPFKSQRYAVLLLNFEICGDYVVPITIEEQVIFGSEFTIQKLADTFKRFVQAIIQLIKNVLGINE